MFSCVTVKWTRLSKNKADKYDSSSKNLEGSTSQKRESSGKIPPDKYFPWLSLSTISGHRLCLQRADVDRDPVHLLQVPGTQILVQKKPVHQSDLSRTQVNMRHWKLLSLFFWELGCKNVPEPPRSELIFCRKFKIFNLLSNFSNQ